MADQTSGQSSGNFVNDTDVAAFLDLVAGRRGHFRLESGHHSQLWLDLDALFAEPRRIDPFVDALTDALRPYAPDVVCGPLLGGAFLAQLVARALGAGFFFAERVPSADGGMYQARYRLPPAFADRLRGKRVAIVDDVMSAGSALRGTYEALREYEAVPIVAGALLVLGSAGAEFFGARGLPVCAVARDEFQLWLPAECPMCDARTPVEDLTTPVA